MGWGSNFRMGWVACPTKLDTTEHPPPVPLFIKESMAAVIGYRMAELRRERPVFFALGILAAPSALVFQVWEMASSLLAALAL